MAVAHHFMTHFPQIYPFECSVTSRDLQQGQHGSQGQKGPDFSHYFNSGVTFHQVACSDINIILHSEQPKTLATTTKSM